MTEGQLPYDQTDKPRRKVRPVRKKPVNDHSSDQAEVSAAAHEQELPILPTPLRMDLLVRLFFGCLVVGIAVTTLALFENSFLRRIGLMGPVLATVAYPVLGILFGIASRPATRERFADNCYYLGFIFTQAALLFAFLPSTLLNRPLTSQDVLGFFGMAIGAALAGLIARTVLVQMGSSLPEADDALHNEVEEVARQVSLRGKAIVAEFQTMASAASGVTTAMNSNLEAINTSLGRFDDVLRRELASFETGSGAVSTAMDGAAMAVDGHHKAFGEHVRQAALALELLQRGLNQQSEEALQALRETATSISSGARSFEGLSGIGDEVRDLEAKVGHLTELAEGLTGLSSHVAARLQGVAGEITEQLQSAASDAASQITSSAERSGAGLEASAQKAAANLGAQSRSFEEDLAATTETLVAALREFREELSRLSAEREPLTHVT